MIGNVGSSTNVTTPTVNTTSPTSSSTPTSTTAQGSAGVNPALYQSFTTALAAPGPLGLPTPVNPEDASVILAQAELLLDQTAAQNRASRIETSFGGARTSIAALNSSLGTITTNLNARATAEGTLKTQQATLDGLTAHSTALGAVAGAYAAASGELKAPDTGKTVSGADFKSQVTKAVSDLQAIDQSSLSDADKATLQSTIASLQGTIGSIDTSTTYGPSDYQAVQSRLSSDSATLAATKASIDTTQLPAARKAVADTQKQIDTLNAAITSGFALLQQQTQALLSVFSQVATDAFGSGDHARDQAKSTDLDKGFDDLNAAAQKFRDAETARADDDAKARETDDKAVDAQRVADLVAGLVTGLASLVAVVRQEAGAPPGPDTNDARLSGNRFRFAL